MVVVKKMNIFQFLKHCLKNKTWYLGYTWKNDIEVIELQFPIFGGPKRRDKTLIHEAGHLRINHDTTDLSYWENMQIHNRYDRVTWHGLFQKRWDKTLTIPEWEYTDKELVHFGKGR